MNKDKDVKKFENWVRSNVPEQEINPYHKQNLKKELLSSFDKKPSHFSLFNFVKMKGLKFKLVSLASAFSVAVAAVLLVNQFDWRSTKNNPEGKRIVSAEEVLEKSQQIYESNYSGSEVYYTKTKYETFKNEGEKSLLESAYFEEVWRDDLGQVKRYIYLEEQDLDYKEMVIFSEGNFVEYSEGHLTGTANFDNLIDELLINVGCENSSRCDLIYSKNTSDLAKLVKKMVDQKDQFSLIEDRYLDGFPESFSLEFKKSEDLLGKGNKSYFYFDKKSYQLLAIQIVDSNYFRDMRAVFLDSNYIPDNEVFSTKDFSQDAELIQEIDLNEWGEIFFSEYYNPEYPNANFKGIGRIVTNNSITGGVDYSEVYPYAFESSSHFLLLMGGTPEYDQATQFVDTDKLVLITASVEEEINYERPTAIEVIYEIKEVDIDSIAPDDEIQNIEDIPTVDPEVIFSQSAIDPSDRLVTLTRVNDFSFIIYAGGEVNCYDKDDDYLCEVYYEWSPDGVITDNETVTLFFPSQNSIDEYYESNPSLEGNLSPDLAVMIMYNYCGEGVESYPELYTERSEQYLGEREVGGNIMNRGYVACRIGGENVYEFGIYQIQDENYPYSLVISDYDRKNSGFSYTNLIEESINFPQTEFTE